MLNRRQNSALVRQRQQTSQNQENATVFAGKTAIFGKPQLGKNGAGVQTRARAALGDRSNTIHGEVQAAANKPPSKVQPMAKKVTRKEPEQAVAKPVNIVNRMRNIAKAVSVRTRSQEQPSAQSRPLKIVPIPKLEEESAQNGMDIDEINRSVLMDVDSDVFLTPSKSNDENASMPNSEQKFPNRSCYRAHIREQLIRRYGGGISEPGSSSSHRVTNPDLADEKNTQMVSNYVYAIFDYLQDIEIQRMPLTEDFLEHCSEITSRMRYVLVDWMVQIHSRFEMLPETFYLAVGLMDRYLSTPAGIEITKENLQLLGVTAMMVAAKFEEMYPPEVSDFVYVTGNSFSTDQIRDFEWKLLSGTGFFCSLPTPIVFLRRFSRLIQASSEMHSAAKYFLELTTTEYSLCHLTGCLRAAASICLSHALMHFGPQSCDWKAEEVAETTLRSMIADAWMPNLQFTASFTVDELFPVVQQIAAVAERQVAPSKYRAIHTKYSSPDVYLIAIRTEVRSPLLSMFAVSPEDVQS